MGRGLTWIATSWLALGLTLGSVLTAPVATAGEHINLTTAFGTPLEAYVAGPEDARRAALILHDRYGLNASVQEWVERYADLGYRALAIDMYDGRRAEGWKHATQIMQTIDPVWTEANIAAAMKHLQSGDRQIVVVGWDYGAAQALLASLSQPETVAATVLYYPSQVVTDQQQLQALAKPVLVLVAERDEQLSVSEITAFKDGLSKTRVDFAVMGLDAGRGFSNPLNPDYDEEMAAISWETTQEFLAKYLSQ